MFGRFSFGTKLAKNKRFNYTPIYYDERKEKLEQKIKAIKGEGSEGDTPIRRTSIKFERRYSERHTYQKSSMIRVAVIAAILVAIVFYIIR